MCIGDWLLCFFFKQMTAYELRISDWSADVCSSDRAAALADGLRGQGFEARPAPSLRAAAETADIVSCATLAIEPLIEGAWLGPGTHLDLVGSFTPAMRETDDACVGRGRIYVDTMAALEDGRASCRERVCQYV